MDDGSFNEIWIWKNPITVTENGFGIREVSVTISSSYASYNGSLQNRFQINFKTNDNDGYKLYTLNYTNKDDSWKLVSRERVNTIINEITREETSYCVDTINNNCRREGKKFKLTHDYIFRLDDRVCY